MVWFTSDTHFGHANIIKYCKRPFNNVDEMNQTIINNWNTVVAPEDEVYHLGDLAFFNKNEKLTEMISQLNGTKYLIIGNHDKYSKGMFYKSGFSSVINGPIKYCNFLLSHVPAEFGNNKCKANIHGHIHDNKKEYFLNGKNIYYNVSVEWHNYTPIKFKTIQEYYNAGSRSSSAGRASHL